MGSLRAVFVHGLLGAGHIAEFTVGVRERGDDHLKDGDNLCFFEVRIANCEVGVRGRQLGPIPPREVNDNGGAVEDHGRFANCAWYLWNARWEGYAVDGGAGVECLWVLAWDLLRLLVVVAVVDRPFAVPSVLGVEGGIVRKEGG